MTENKCLDILPEDQLRWCRYDAMWELILHSKSI